MYCGYCVHEYHSYITFTDEPQFSKTFYPSSGGTSSSGILLYSHWFMFFPNLNQHLQFFTELFNKILLVIYHLYLSCLVVYPIVLYYIMTRADTAKYDRFNPAFL